MSVDISMAFIIALMIRMFALTNKYLKYMVVLTMCVTLTSIYFNNENTIGFIGEMDLAIWIVFVVIFDTLLDLLVNGIVYVINNHIKE